MKLRFLVVGRDRNEAIVEVASDYLERIGRYVSTELVEVKEAPLGRKAHVAEIKKAEAERLLRAVSPGDRLVVLDERGRSLSSAQVSGRIDTWMQSAVRSVAFAIGGPSGLDPAFVQRADECWSLSALTLPHRVARLVLFEQVYRGLTMIRGEPYHK